MAGRRRPGWRRGEIGAKVESKVKSKFDKATKMRSRNERTGVTRTPRGLRKTVFAIKFDVRQEPRQATVQLRR